MSETQLLKQMQEWHAQGVKLSTMLALISRVWMPEVDHRENHRRMKHNLWPKK